MDYAGNLSTNEYDRGFAVCYACNRVYRDDHPLCGSIECPHCHNAVVRGLSREYVGKMLDEFGLKKMESML